MDRLVTNRLTGIAITGATASGKSDFALQLARSLRDDRQINAEIICCDSVQVYRGFDIGAAKPAPEERAEFPHHLIDIVTWRDEFDAGKYAALARNLVAEIKSRGALPIFVGGSGLYLRAFFGQGFAENLPKDRELRDQLDEIATDELFTELKAIDPVRAGQLHPNDRVRILRAVELCRLTAGPVSAQMPDHGRVTARKTPEREQTHLVFLNPERPILHQRIAERAKSMLIGGLLEEVQGLVITGCPATAKPMQAIGYRETLVALQAAGGVIPRIDLGALAEQIIVATRQYAKRQTTWFKGTGPDQTVGSLTHYKSAIAGLCALR